MKVFEIKEQGETTHICFDGNENEAKEWYVEETMCDENEIDSVVEIPQEKWKEIKVTFQEEDGFTTTVEELMKGNKYPEILCSTAYL